MGGAWLEIALNKNFNLRIANLIQIAWKTALTISTRIRLAHFGLYSYLVGN